MNQPLSVYELIANASLLVQGVMALLVLASVVSWMMILQRWMQIGWSERDCGTRIPSAHFHRRVRRQRRLNLALDRLPSALPTLVVYRRRKAAIQTS